jgi:hypothetical protein
LKSVEETAIVPQSGRAEEKKRHHQVQLPQLRLPVPRAVIFGRLAMNPSVLLMDDVDIVLAVHDGKVR